MYIVLFIMAAGCTAGFIFRKQENLIKITDRLILYAIYVLLFLLGLSVGSKPEIIENMHVIGYKALLIALGGIAGSIFFSVLIYKYLFQSKKPKT